ncbi:hypothetical protein D3C76_1855340 [compost metagenome]
MVGDAVVPGSFPYPCYKFWFAEAVENDRSEERQLLEFAKSYRFKLVSLLGVITGND